MSFKLSLNMVNKFDIIIDFEIEPIISNGLTNISNISNAFVPIISVITYDFKEIKIYQTSIYCTNECKLKTLMEQKIANIELKHNFKDTPILVRCCINEESLLRELLTNIRDKNIFTYTGDFVTNYLKKRYKKYNIDLDIQISGLFETIIEKKIKPTVTHKLYDFARTLNKNVMKPSKNIMDIRLYTTEYYEYLLNECFAEVIVFNELYKEKDVKICH